MKKIAFVLLMIPFVSFSQQSLEVKRGKFYKGEQLISAKEFVAEMKGNSEAFKLASSAKSSYGASNVLGAIGGFMVGWPLGTAIAGGNPEWGLAAAGAAVLVVAIPISSSSTKKMKEAAAIYNNGLSTSSSLQLKFNLSPTRTGLVLHF